jgi:hypothetical protein
MNGAVMDFRIIADQIFIQVLLITAGYVGRRHPAALASSPLVFPCSIEHRPDPTHYQARRCHHIAGISL